MKLDTPRQTMSSPAPSLTLHITKRDGERFLEACGAVKAMMDLQSPKPLHERLFLACEQCSHPLVVQFLEKTSSLSSKESKAASLIFLESDKSTKLRDLFSILSSTGNGREPSLFRSQVASLFRTVLTAIHSCLKNSETHEKVDVDVVVEGKPTDRPAKRTKLHHGDATEVTKETSDNNSQIDPSQSRSWDSSLATLRDDDDNTSSARKEIENIVNYAASDLFSYASAKCNVNESDFTLDFATFGSWYNDQGGTIVPWLELLRLSKWRSSRSKGTSENKENSSKSSLTSPSNFPTTDSPESRTVVSFDFSGSGSPNPLIINITEDNLHALKTLVTKSDLMQRPAVDICKLLMRNACFRSANGQEIMLLRKDEFTWTTRSLISEQVYESLSTQEKQFFSDSFFRFFSCFEEAKSFLHEGEVDLKEFAVGFCFLCSGNKSAKLAAGFEILDTNNRGYLTEDQLLRYLQAYLTMLVALSLLIPVGHKTKDKPISPSHRRAMRQALENGAKWTLSHFLKASRQAKNEYSFECFADWYSSGGYNIAPWLELLDLNKVMSLIAEPSHPLDLPVLDKKQGYHTGERRTRPRDRVSSLRRHHAMRRPGLQPDLLFTFPLGNRRSLVVLKDDAAYVRGVVELLGLLSLKPDDLWTSLSAAVQKRRKPSAKSESAVYVSDRIFVQSMLEICPKPSRKRTAPGDTKDGLNSPQEEVLSNFFQCFDIDQCDSVAIDELMGGLTILCGGKKSQKLSFAFSIFDTRPRVAGKKRGMSSLSGEDLFLFLRSILIVTFSTCRQSLDLSDEMVGKCIADTANMICNDVMRHQWEAKRSDRVDFDEFGQWYNDGGFERAPWLELLDLRKWVLLSESKKDVPEPPKADGPSLPPPGEDVNVLDSAFFDAESIMQMDSMDDMDMMLMQSASHDKDDLNRISKSFSYSPRSQRAQAVPKPPVKSGNPLKFHLNTNDSHGGFMLSLSQARIRHFRHLLEISGLHLVELETACNKLLAKAHDGKISKHDFLAVALSLVPRQKADAGVMQILSDIFNSIFAGFDHGGRGEANVMEMACGFTVLCRGKKSDKLEFAFEVLEKDKKGCLGKQDMARYLRSFLTVLLTIAFSTSIENDPIDDSLSSMSGIRFDRTTKMLVEASTAGSDWAASLAFSDVEKQTAMSFDDFADWYTSAGYSSIPWLELLDLQKWALSAESK